MSRQKCFIASEDGLLYGTWSRSRLTVSGIESAPPLNYLAADWKDRRLYATARQEICAFDLTCDRPRFLYKVSCMGDVACHLCLSPERKHIFCANYISGNVTVFRIFDEGFGYIQSITGLGRCGNDRKRQDGPHAHYCTFVGGNLWTVDLGQDAIFIFPWNGEKLGREIGRITFPAGSGPRHFVHDSANDRVYCVSELSCELFVVDVRTLCITARIPVAGAGNALSAVRLSPDGNTIAVGIRSGDRIALIDTSVLRIKDKVCPGEKCLRDFDFADRETLFVCGQESSSVSVLKLTGASIQQIAVKTPMCVLFETKTNEEITEH